MKKRLILIFVGLGTVLLIIGLMFFSAISKPIYIRDVLKYCIDNTAINATSFVRQGLSSDPLYAFWFAEESPSDMQELFIFRKSQIGFIDLPNRWSFKRSGLCCLRS